ncbi:MAG: hypothetical protein ACO3RV_01500 [Luteolibacter sp.]
MNHKLWARTKFLWVFSILASAGSLAASPSVQEAIPASIAAVSAPDFDEVPSGSRIAVSIATEKGQRHVNHGIEHLNAGWDFEAGRHFAAAMLEDPECLMAHWGMLFALLDAGPESATARNAALERMMSLIEQGAGTELERGYAYGLIKLIEEGSQAGAVAFQKVAARFPNESQAAVMSALLGRGGFDAYGKANPAQEKSEAILQSLMQRNPRSPSPLVAYLMIRAEGAVTADLLKSARKLAAQWPTYPPYQHTLGHYEWRYGNAALAAEAFGRAESLYRAWMDQHQVSLADCPEWIKARCYRCFALEAAGDHEAALGLALELLATQADPTRAGSRGNRYLWWEAKTVGARLLLSRADADFADADGLMPEIEELAQVARVSTAPRYLAGLRLLVDARVQIRAGNLNAAWENMNALNEQIALMVQERPQAVAAGEISSWLRAHQGLEMLSYELRGDLAVLGVGSIRSAAFNWFSAASERQSPSSLLMPPVVLHSMAKKLGDWHIEAGMTEDAIDAYQRGAIFAPHDIKLLEWLHQALIDAGRAVEAEPVSAKIRTLNGGK